MADRKRRRRSDETASLRLLLHTGGITVGGLSELLKKLQAVDLEHSGMHFLRGANTEQFMKIRHSFTMPLIAGGTWDWELADPNLLLQLAIDTSPYLRQLYSAAVRRSRPSAANPWHLAIGFDEFMPGQGGSMARVCIPAELPLHMTFRSDAAGHRTRPHLNPPSRPSTRS
jgi:hypothetical protein